MESQTAMKGWLPRVAFEPKITSTFIRTARCQSNRPEPSISPVKSTCSLGVLFLLLIVFLWFRLRTLGLCDRDRWFLLHRLIRLDYGFLLRRSGLLRIAMLWVEIFLIWHFISPLLVSLLLVIGELLQLC